MRHKIITLAITILTPICFIHGQDTYLTEQSGLFPDGSSYKLTVPISLAKQSTWKPEEGALAVAPEQAYSSALTAAKKLLPNSRVDCCELLLEHLMTPFPYATYYYIEFRDKASRQYPFIVLMNGRVFSPTLSPKG